MIDDTLYEEYYPKFNPKMERVKFKQDIKKVDQTSKRLSSKEKSQEEPLSVTQQRKLTKYEEELNKTKYTKKQKETKLKNEELKLYIKHKSN